MAIKKPPLTQNNNLIINKVNTLNQPLMKTKWGCHCIPFWLFKYPLKLRSFPFIFLQANNVAVCLIY